MSEQHHHHHSALDAAAIRARLQGLHGRQYWRSLDEIAATPEFEALLQREFPRQAAGWMGPTSRRSFLKVMGASLALAGLTGCNLTQPQEKIVPYVKAPDVSVVPGKPQFYATAMPLNGYALGVLAESHLGRPTKIEGNDRHPASLGATDIWAQASVLELYDPDRAQAVLNLGRISTWSAFTTAISGEVARLRQQSGAGLRFLTGAVTSPTFGAQMQALLQTFPQARWHRYEPVGDDNARAGAQLAFERVVHPIYDLSGATIIVTLDADLFTGRSGGISYARQFVDGRRVAAGKRDMNRLYAIESTPTLTGAMADHRLPLRASQIEQFARGLALALGVDLGGAASGPQNQASTRWITAIAQDLQQYRGASLVAAGDAQPPVVHAIAHAINQALGNFGRTVRFIESPEIDPLDQIQSLRELATDMAAGQVDTLVIIDSNPVLTAPVDLGFADALRRVRLPISMSAYTDETATLCFWHVPQAHYLETWSDVRAFDGTASIIQPLIAPLYQSRSPHELLAAFAGDFNSTSYDLVRRTWQNQQPAGDFEVWWRTTLNAGIVDGSAQPTVDVSIDTAAIGAAQPDTAAENALEVIFRPDPTIWDGRFANNAWLQELPKPLSSLTWDNAAHIAPATAQRLNLANHELVDLRFGGQTVRAPIWIQPGHPEDSVTLPLGYGRTRAGSVGNGAGFNAYALRRSDALWFGSGLEIAKTGERANLATVQSHFSLEGRDIVREGTITEFLQNPGFAQNEYDHEAPPSLYPEHDYSNNHAWAMAIDLNACIGCNACTIACQAENNIPVVGKDQVLRNREMHWIRVDTYFSGPAENPSAVFQPRPCMHCEKAPCEVVCPVEATLHDDEGINNMVYNRCIGTRYCSNNCPYKVRRFNFLQFSDLATPVIRLERNPDVTVRERGVMEKCTYCIQRIQEVRIENEKAGQPIRDGQIVTACQQVCPTQAIVFGDMNDPNSAVHRLREQPLNYGMLAELGTQPRTTYLARLRNPNPALEA